MEGPFETLVPAAGGWPVALAGLAVVALVEPLAVRLRAREASSKWASNARDVVAVVGLAALWVGLRACGLPWAAAFLFAGLAGILVELVRPMPGTAVWRSARAAGVAAVVVAPAALVPGGALAAANRLGSALFQGVP